MNLSTFNPANDIVTTYLDVPNNLITISSSGAASTSGVWLMILDSTSASTIPRIETRGTISNISTSAAFKMIANYFYGTGTYIIDANNGVTQNSTVKVIQFSRPNLDEGLYKNTITAYMSVSSGTLLGLSAVDIVDTNSEGSAFGLTGSMVDMWNHNSKWGTVFYDYGVIVFSDSQGTTGTAFSAGAISGFEWGTMSANKFRVISLAYKTRNILKRSIYFCRAFNKEYNYTFNPTARKSDGRILDSLSANPATYITTIGLYNDANEQIAVAKISPPKKKSFNSESIFRVTLDFAWILPFLIPFGTLSNYANLF